MTEPYFDEHDIDLDGLEAAHVPPPPEPEPVARTAFQAIRYAGFIQQEMDRPESHSMDAGLRTFNGIVDAHTSPRETILNMAMEVLHNMSPEQIATDRDSAITFSAVTNTALTTAQQVERSTLQKLAAHARFGEKSESALVAQGVAALLSKLAEQRATAVASSSDDMDLAEAEIEAEGIEVPDGMMYEDPNEGIPERFKPK